VYILITQRPNSESLTGRKKLTMAKGCRAGPPAEAQFIVPDWEEKVDYGIGLSHQPVRLPRLAGRHDNPLP
jgi:hypothetical protein